jgi:hypothetical protein
MYLAVYKNTISHLASPQGTLTNRNLRVVNDCNAFSNSLLETSCESFRRRHFDCKSASAPVQRDSAILRTVPS